MKLRETLAFIAIVAVLGSFVVPVLAQESGSMERTPDQGMGMGQGMMGGDMMGHGMMSGGMMSGGMMGGGVMSGMMGGDGRPNSQWQTHPDENSSSD
ncbi:MAG: hypothetical protein M0Z28_16170 [Rhodospirillales bacterium]|nr:hypothetical protein [Rhodospirillales bacterium]